MASATYSSGQPSAPLGVKIICVLGAIGGLLGLLGSFAALGVSPVLGLVALVLSVLQIVVVVGLWNLRSWAWALAMISYGLSILFNLVDFNVIGLLINLIIVGYLISKSHLFR